MKRIAKLGPKTRHTILLFTVLLLARIQVELIPTLTPGWAVAVTCVTGAALAVLTPLVRGYGVQDPAEDPDA